MPIKTHYRQVPIEEVLKKLPTNSSENGLVRGQEILAPTQKKQRKTSSQIVEPSANPAGITVPEKKI